jgi:hypothetical protein
MSVISGGFGQHVAPAETPSMLVDAVHAKVARSRSTEHQPVTASTPG